MACFPVEPPLAAILLAGGELHCADEAADVVALISSDRVFISPVNKCVTIKQFHQRKRRRLHAAHFLGRARPNVQKALSSVPHAAVVCCERCGQATISSDTTSMPDRAAGDLLMVKVMLLHICSEGLTHQAIVVQGTRCSFSTQGLS